MGNSFKDLIVWQKSIDFVLQIYKITKTFPSEEIYTLTNQLRRASISIPSNIAEGSKRKGSKEFCNFLRISSGSAAEVETQLLISLKLSYINEFQYTQLIELLVEIQKMLTTLIKNLT